LYIFVGPLRVIVQKWFVQEQECSAGSTLLNELIDFPTTFVKDKQEEGSNLFDDEDVAAWEAETRRWSRTLLLVTSEEQYMKQIFVVCFVLCRSLKFQMISHLSLSK
jgi:tRNA guanosine-2'-O-methyltransferase